MLSSLAKARHAFSVMTAALLVIATTSHAKPSDIAEQWNPPPADKVKLPQYCWSQFDPVFAKESGIKTPMQQCGLAMNHFCPSLVMLNRAQEGKYHPNTRQDMMREALGGLSYTFKAMTATCPLRPDVEAAKAKADAIAPTLPRARR